jgi:hypothetical protein
VRSRIAAVISRALGTAALGAAALVVLGLTASPASAHSTAGLPATDWRSSVVAVQVGGTLVPSIHARTSDLGQHVELSAPADADVTVLGYSGEPYLWFVHGRVLENTRSPAVWLNKHKDIESGVPKSYSASATPQWRVIAARSTYRWHDQRVHATTHTPHDDAWTIPLVVGQRQGAIDGRLDLVPGPALLLPLLAIVLGIAAVTLLARAWPRVTAVVALAAAVGAAAQVTGTWEATTGSLWQRVGPSAYAVGAVAGALAIAWIVGERDDRRYAEVLIVGGIVLAIAGGLAHIDWLTHSQLPSAWNPAVARALLIAQLDVGAGAAIAGVMLLEASARDYDTAPVAPRPIHALDG